MKYIIRAGHMKNRSQIEQLRYVMSTCDGQTADRYLCVLIGEICKISENRRKDEKFEFIVE